MNTSRQHTDEDLAFSQSVASEMVDTMAHAPVDIRFGALSLLCGGMFSVEILPERRIAAFEDFANVVRQTIRESLP